MQEVNMRKLGRLAPMLGLVLMGMLATPSFAADIQSE